MITRAQISFSVGGQRFNPAAHDLPWTDTYLAPEDDAGWGTGTVHFDLPSLADQENSIRSLHEFFIPQLSAIREAGVTVIDLFITWTYEDQCAGGFTENELRWIAELGCCLAIDCESAPPLGR